MTKSTESRQLSVPPLLIRTDVNENAGIGHLMRCLTISRIWKQKGGKVVFLLSSLSSAMEKFLEPYHLDLRIQQVQPGNKQDAKKTLDLANNLHAAWVIADGYWFGPEFQQIVYSQDLGIMLIDALGNHQRNYAHILLNANIYAQEKYYSLREPDTKMLLGLKYLPLRPRFADYTPRERKMPVSVKRVLISLGGTDPENLTQLVLELMLDLFPAFHCTVIAGPGNEHFDSLRKIEIKFPNMISLKYAPKNLPELMDKVDFAILAGGSTVWEAMYMGLPCILTSFADNQVRVCKALEERGLALYSGHFHGKVPSKLIHDIHKLLSSSQLYTRLSGTGKKLIDGKGPTRIVDAMLSYSNAANSEVRTVT